MSELTEALFALSSVAYSEPMPGHGLLINGEHGGTLRKRHAIAILKHVYALEERLTASPSVTEQEKT